MTRRRGWLALPAGVLAVGLLATFGTGLAKDERRSLTVMLPSTAGLFVGNDVGVLGVPVGRVESITPRGTAVEVVLSITDEDLKIPQDVGAAVVARSVAVDRYVELTPVYSGGPTLADHSVIPVERTATPVEFDEVLGSLKEFSDDVSSSGPTRRSIGDLLAVSDTALAGNGNEINTAITSLADALAEVDRQSPTIVGALRSASTLTTTLAENRTMVRRFIRDVADASDLLADERQNIGSALRSLSTAVDDIGRIGSAHGRAIRDDVRGLTRVLRATYRSRDDIEEILEALPLASQNLHRAVSDQGQFRVQLDPAALTPLAGAVDALCGLLGEDLCGVLAVTPTLPGLPSLGGSR